jgi:hypothetical protein
MFHEQMSREYRIMYQKEEDKDVDKFRLRSAAIRHIIKTHMWHSDKFWEIT